MKPETLMSPLIIVDWGTTNFRAYLVERRADGCGVCRDEVVTTEGLLNIQREYPDVLKRNISHWLEPSHPTPILLSGMVGSPSGWIEVPHIPCPANLQKLAQNAHQINNFNNGNTWIIPGLSGLGISGYFDVMRGEEVQYFGAKKIIEAQNLRAPEVICFPGTHNKWIKTATSTGTALDQFSTSMTGEIFNLLIRHSILSNSIAKPAPWQQRAFLEGLDNSASQGGIMHQLFTVRSLQLSGAHTHDNGEAYLSGLLIGTEIRSMLKESTKPNKVTEVAIVGSDKLAHRYLSAIDHLGHCGYTINSGEATIAGALEIAQYLNPQA